MIIDPDGNIVPVNTPGELLSRGYCVMQKYWGEEEKTADAITNRGWYRSGYVLKINDSY